MKKYILFALSFAYPPIRLSANKSIFKYAKQHFPGTKLFAATKLNDDDSVISANVNATGLIARELLYSLKLLIFIIRKHKEISCVYLLSPAWLCQFPLVLARIFGIKTVFDIRSAPILDNKLKSFILISLDKLTFMSAWKITSHNSTLIEKQYGKRYLRKLVKLPLGFEGENKPRLSVATRPYKFVMPTTIDKERRVNLVCDAFVGMKDMHLYLYGGGKEFENIKSRYSNQANIHLMGSVPYEEMMQKLPEYDYGIAFIPRTTYYEYQPALKTIEYIGAGLPVIATNTHGNRVYIDSSNGLLIDDTTGALKEAIQRICEISYDRLAIHRNAKKYTWENITREVFEQLGLFDMHTRDECGNGT